MKYINLFENFSDERIKMGKYPNCKYINFQEEEIKSVKRANIKVHNAKSYSSDKYSYSITITNLHFFIIFEKGEAIYAIKVEDPQGCYIDQEKECVIIYCENEDIKVWLKTGKFKIIK